MNKKAGQLLSIIGVATTISVPVIELSDVAFFTENKGTIYFSLVSIIIFVFLFYWYYYEITQKTIYELQIAVIGRIAVGKSVFITMLFDELQRAKEKGYEFIINDKFTVERVFNDVDSLSVGQWLPGTKVANSERYKGVLINKRFPRKNYDLTLTDYSGEQFLESMNEKERDWSHNQPYFDYIKKSELVFLAIDVSESESCFRSRTNTISDYLATINLLASFEKGKEITRPFSLLFLQSDRLGDGEEYLNEEQIKNNYSKLIEVCERRCRSFGYFFVTAVGKDAKKFKFYNGANSQHERNINLDPKNVLESFFWGISKLKI